MMMEKLMNEYGLPVSTTEEDLEMRWEHVLRFGKFVILSGYRYMGRHQPGYFAAIYAAGSEDFSCEDEIRLNAISAEMFEDAGHAAFWAMNRITKLSAE